MQDRLSLSFDLAVVRRSTWSSLLLPFATVLAVKIDRHALANTIWLKTIYSAGVWQSKHATLILIIRQSNTGV
jgi:hypothetical protein